MRKSKKLVNVSICLVTVSLVIFGCASIFSKSDYSVAFKSQPDEVEISITDEKGSVVYRGTTPTTVVLTASAGFFNGMDYIVKCSKEGYESHTAKLESGLDGWYIGNILLGGLIGMLIVDPATGAMWALPTEMVATLSPKSTSLNQSEQGIKVVSIDDIPKGLHSELIKIN